MNLRRGTRIRIWATRTLKDYLVKGYTLNERRLQEKATQTVLEQAEVLSAEWAVA